MAENYGSRQLPIQAPAPTPKRIRTELDHLPPGFSCPPRGFYSPHSPQGTLNSQLHASKDTRYIQASYDRYLHTQRSFASGAANSYGGPEPSRTAGMPALGVGCGFYNREEFASRNLIDPIRRPIPPPSRVIPLPPNASRTLFVEGLPSNGTRRRYISSFPGFHRSSTGDQEIQTHAYEDTFILCFADFSSPSFAAKALNALQGYKMDLHDPHSRSLRLEFAQHHLYHSRSNSGSPSSR